MEIKIVSGIYALFDAEDETCLYVGQSKDIYQRFTQHLKLLRSGKHRRKEFVEWWVSSGSNKDSIRLEVMEECEAGNRNQKEIDWFNILKPKYYGQKPTLKGNWEKTEAVRRKMSESASHRIEGMPRNEHGRILYSFSCNVCSADYLSIKKKSYFCSNKCRHFEKRASFRNNFTKEQVLKMRGEGMTYREIGKHLGTSHVTLIGMMKKSD